MLGERIDKILRVVGPFLLGVAILDIGLSVGFGVGRTIASGKESVDPLYLIGYWLLFLVFGGRYWLLLILGGLLMAGLPRIRLFIRIVIVLAVGLVAGYLYLLQYGPGSFSI